MQIDIYQVDAFADGLFSGNPAAVCPLDEFLPDDTMQAIAAENNLSETAFFIPKDDQYAIRWFTPECEVDLCGHATLATAFVIFNHLDKACESIVFDSRSGPLYVKRLENKLIQLNFPAIGVDAVDIIPELAEALGGSPLAMYRSIQDHLVIYDTKQEILAVQPDLNKLNNLDLRGVIISSVDHDDYDFVSRFFAPKCNVAEDPVTGSAHCILAPYWGNKLGKSTLKAKQISRRGGELLCEVRDDRVLLAGQAELFLQGKIFI